MSTAIHSTPIPPDLAGHAVHRPEPRQDARQREYDQRKPTSEQGRGARSQKSGVVERYDPVERSGTADKATKQKHQDQVELSEEAKMLQKLAARDREVRAHEAAHAAVGGRYAGAPSFTYQQGPDGKRYAVGGEVGLDASAIPGDPEATAEKMSQIQRAALAPAQPSGTDRRIAAKAAQTEAKARIEMAEEQRTENKEAIETEEDKTAAGEIGSAVITEEAPAVRSRISPPES